jgi:membrane-bound ClpP family serine protease
VRPLSFTRIIVETLTAPSVSSIFLCIAAVGYIILIVSRNATLSYIAVYLAAAYVPARSPQ